MADRRRTFSTPVQNTYASDYVNNLRAKVKFSGTSNLAKNVALQGGTLPLKTPNGSLKPYQGTYGFSSTSNTFIPYCLNTSRSYRDLLDITKGKYLLTPPNPVGQTITLETMEPSQLYNGVFFNYGYTGSSPTIANITYVGVTGGATGYINGIEFNQDTRANQWIHVDPSYNIFYDSESCLNSVKNFKNISVSGSTGAQINIDRISNLNLLNGFTYPVKFSLNYESQDCINVNNTLQPSASSST
jgi:hypothetical protein